MKCLLATTAILFLGLTSRAQVTPTNLTESSPSSVESSSNSVGSQPKANVNTERAPASARFRANHQDKRVNSELAMSYKKMHLDKKRTEVLNKRTAPPLREGTTFKGPSEDYLYMDQEVLEIPDKDPYRFEVDYKTTPDADALRPAERKPSQTKGSPQLFDENTIDENDYFSTKVKKKSEPDSGSSLNNQ